MNEERKLVPEGKYRGRTHGKEKHRDTRKGSLPFLPCEITEPGELEGRVIDYLLPRKYAEFLGLLVSRDVVITVGHVEGKNGGTFANVVGLDAPEKRKGEK